MSVAPDPAPRRRDPEGRRRAILRAATEIIVEQGHTALTHRAIASRAGVALGSTTQYFDSIDELRETALQSLADEIDAELAGVEQMLEEFATAPERATQVLHEFLRDPRQVYADIALMTAGTTDPPLRVLALRWFDRLVDMIAAHIGRERATAVAVFLDGATMHAGLHDAPLSREELLNVVRALIAMPVGPETTRS